jgi:cytochrome c oxidase cbb3-type subunit III
MTHLVSALGFLRNAHNGHGLDAPPKGFYECLSVWRRGSVPCALCAAILIVTSCNPPGKPGPQEESSQDITDFTTLYTKNCTGCHGLDGKNGPARILNDSLYLAVIPRQQLQATIENGRPGTPMPAWLRNNGGPLTQKQITALVDGIEKNWAKPASLHGVPLPAYSEANEKGDAGHGKKLFVRDCFMCHGPGAPIGSVTDPNYLELSSDQNLRTSIIVGRPEPDLGMPDYQKLNLGRALTNQDITDLVAYMSSLRPVSEALESRNTNDNGERGVK